VQEPNDWTLNIEQAGFAAWSRRAWLKRLNTVKRAAFWTAWWCKKYDIPRRYRSTKALNNGKRRGWTTHAALAASKWSSSTHTDPGPNYPLFGKVSFNALLLYYRARIAADGGCVNSRAPSPIHIPSPVTLPTIVVPQDPVIGGH
jgi:hypothetical protein